MNRRGFLSSILVACAAPAIVRADSLMRIIPMDMGVLAPTQDIFDAITERYIALSRGACFPVDMITKEALRIAHEKMQFIGTINRQYEEAFSLPSTHAQGGDIWTQKWN